MEKLRLFYARLMLDAALAEKFDKILKGTDLEGVSEEQIQQVVALAKEAGVELSAEDIQNYVDAVKNDSEVLNNEQLEMVAAGKETNGTPYVNYNSEYPEV